MKKLLLSLILLASIGSASALDINKVVEGTIEGMLYLKTAKDAKDCDLLNESLKSFAQALVDAGAPVKGIGNMIKRKLDTDIKKALTLAKTILTLGPIKSSLTNQLNKKGIKADEIFDFLDSCATS